MTWSKDEILSAVGGKILREGKDRLFGEVVTDSSQVKRGSIFVALKGERLDGHSFLADAVRRGAGCFIVHRRVDRSLFKGATIIRVKDTLRALGDLAYYRRKKIAPQVLAVTGSNGKTTTKEMVAAIFERSSLEGRPLRSRVLKTEGNYNNLVGLPLTLLRLRRGKRVAVVEIGTSQPGEIARLAQIADPDLGLITSVAPAHLTGLKTLAGVAQEKGALFLGMRCDATAVVNVDDPWVRRLGGKFAGRKITYGRRGLIRAEHCQSLGTKGLEFTLRAGSERCRVRLGLYGEHNVSNALGAAALAYALGVDLAAIRKGLGSVRPFPMRMQVERWRGIGIINDAYNANPASMEAALKTLVEMGGKGEKVAILGDMLELGRESPGNHLELGKKVARYGVDRLYLLGEQALQVKKGALRAGMKEARILVARDHGEIGRMLRAHVKKGDWLLFKGSRGMKIEKVLEALKTSGS